ncbi:homoserine O-acetyltransferase [Hymenobacter taeanensis]|uniref:Homoserine O-acetyltransferase n=1 Tax=Hymenobacter taeanensis TaxID=2735321 RepID=A0A6M6BE52_9BACT|nr:MULTISPECIES: homoserine O-acetyltransferase [Hymenobacter]QJX46259.1 homoserine O-acetyltransferase [Hymenobacter taeanensis]UOQ80113.1 homoserine O-acetyltransferase [Hymenobacter sp. 5414T-23]
MSDFDQQIFRLPRPLRLESGAVLPHVEVAYHTYGHLNASRDNVVWVCHALTANADVLSWWPGLFGKDTHFDPADWFIVCANILGSCYGSTGPLTPNPETEEVAYQQFPLLTIRDLVSAHEALREHLALPRIHTLIGGSLGGQQAVEWAIQRPELFENLVLLATSAQHSAWGIAFNEAQRLAIQADPTYTSATPDGGAAGLRAARAVALLSYRSYEAYDLAQTEPNESVLTDFRASSYQRYQGDKLVARFNAHSYVTLSRAMDSHNVGRGRGGVKAALGRIRARTLVIGITSDVLFPPSEQQLLAQHIQGALYAEMGSQYGHDGFLIETAQITHFLERFYAPSYVSQPAPQLSI